MINKESAKDLLIYLMCCVVILLQGGYFAYQASAIILLTAAVTFRNTIKTSILLLCFGSLMLTGFVLSDILNKSFNPNSIFEITKYLCILLILCKSDIKNKMLFGAYLGITVMSAIGICAFIGIFPSSELATVIDGRYRLQSVIGYANVTAVFCGIGAILGFYYRKEYKSYSFLHTVCLFINMIAMILTFSRFGIASFCLAVIVMICLKYKVPGRYIFYAGIVAILFIAAVFMAGKGSRLIGPTLASRLIYYYDGFLLFLNNPFGIGVYGWEDKQYLVQTADYSVKYIHNGYLQLLLDGGLPSLAGFAAIAILGLRNLYRKRNENIYLYLLGIAVFILAHSFVDIDLTYGGILFVLGLVLGFGIEQNIQVKRSVLLIIAVFAVYTGIYSFYVKTDPDTVQFISQSYSIAYQNNDYEGMYQLSKVWLEKAPRQQSAYDAHYVALDKLGKKEEMNALQHKVEYTNSTLNYFCRYLTRHKNITFPQGGK